MKYIRNFTLLSGQENIKTIGGSFLGNVTFNGETYTRRYELVDEITANNFNIQAVYPSATKFPVKERKYIRGGMGNFTLKSNEVTILPSSPLTPVITVSLSSGGALDFSVALSSYGEYTGTVTLTIVSTNYCLRDGKWGLESIEKELTFNYTFELKNIKVGIFYSGTEGNSLNFTRYSSFLEEGFGPECTIHSFYCGYGVSETVDAIKNFINMFPDSLLAVFVGDFFTTNYMLSVFSDSAGEIAGGVNHILMFGNSNFNVSQFIDSTSIDTVCFTSGIREAARLLGEKVSQEVSTPRENYYFVGLSDFEWVIPSFASGLGNESLNRMETPNIEEYMATSEDTAQIDSLANAIVSNNGEDTMVLVPSGNVASALGSAFIKLGYNVYEGGEYMQPYIPIYPVTNTWINGPRDIGQDSGISGGAYGVLSNSFLFDLAEIAFLDESISDAMSSSPYDQWTPDENGCYTVATWDVGVIDM